MKTTDRQKAGLMRHYRGLIKKLGISEEERKAMLLNNYGVESSKDLYVEELQELCAWLAEQANTKEWKLQEARNRVYGAVGGYLKLINIFPEIKIMSPAEHDRRIAYMEGVACRNTGYKEFNKIPIERLNNVSHLFSNKQKDYKKGSVVADIEVERLKYLN